jgi:2-hydroxycyclohexanecarboxyl-CoA dehydrogenase
VSGRVAFITGAASGICRATALLLANDGYGILAMDYNEEGAKATAKTIEEGGGQALGVFVDVANKESVRKAVAEGIARFGRVDVLVSGAGYAKNAPILEMEEEAWDRMVDVHLKGAFLTSQAVLPHMKEQGYGRIVCISSQNAETGSTNHAHYAAAKAGILGLVRSLAKDTGKWGVTVNAVMPGATDTPLNAGISPERFKMLSNTPVGRVGQPEDIAYAIRYLASEQAGYTSGAWLRVNGGM